jgi:hypothetical protein
MKKNSECSAFSQNVQSSKMATPNDGEINQTFLMLDFLTTESGKEVGGAYINVNERLMLVTSFIDNEHFSSLESFILQMNNAS